MRKPAPQLLLATLVLLSASCRQEPIRTYPIAKESTPAAVPGGPSESVPSVTGVTWIAPSSWEARAPTSVRIGNYAIPDPSGGQPADFAITSFPGDVGGDLANVNRWRQQIGLAGISETELPSQLERVSAPAGEFIIVTFANSEQGLRVLAAIFKQPDKSWFFKMAGPNALVAAQDQAFRALLQSVGFGEGLRPPAGIPPAGSAGGNTNELPAGHPPIDGDLPPGHPLIGGLASGRLPGVGDVRAPAPGDLPIGGLASSGARAANTPAGAAALRWAAPDHWTAKELAPLRRASYTVHAPGGLEADFSIISLPGDAGGLHENVNRWRGQIGLAPSDEAAIDQGLRHMDSAGLHFDVVEFASEAPDAQRVLGALLHHAGETWFFKMSGPDSVVAAERETFIKFIRSVRVR